jgi:soluble lytic murein transglycosylase
LRRQRSWSLARFAACCVVACTTPRGPEPTPSHRAPLGLAPAGAAGGSASPGAPVAGLAEEAFTPWLTRPGFERVAEAVEAGDARLASAELALRLAAAPPAAADAPSLALLAGLFHERAGEHALALAAFERAKVEGFPLSAFAAAGRARALIALRRGAEALIEARALPAQPSLDGTRHDLLADAAFVAGERQGGLDALRQALSAGATSAERWSRELRLARELLIPASDAGATPAREAVDEALALARRVQALAATKPELAKQARELEAQALALLPPPVQKQEALPALVDLLGGVEALVDARRYAEALAQGELLARRLAGTSGQDDVVCRLELARAKANAARRERKAAFDSLVENEPRCRGDAELHVRVLYNAGKYAAADARHSDAVRFFARVESEHHTHSLADDARLQAAIAYLELGVEARFTDLLRTLPDEYPSGDMALDALFRLAVRRIDKGDWSSAASVLTRAVALVGGPQADAARGGEVAGRERYFEARSALALGQRGPALDTLEAVVRELPLSYYMLQAHRLLGEHDAPRAERAVRDALARAGADSRPRPPERLAQDAGFSRALELFKLGEIAPAVAELDALGLTRPGAGPELLWTVARTYAQAGADRLAHDVARRRLTDWLSRWPAGDWHDAWRIAFPEPYPKVVAASAKRAGLSTSLVYAIMREESAFDPDAESIADAHGLMQLIVPTARAAAKGTALPHDRRALKRPSVNVELGCRTLVRYGGLFPENPLLAIPAYNAGPGRVREWLKERPSADFDLWIELIPYLETRRYVKRVLASRAAYAFLADPMQGVAALGLPKKVRTVSP